MHTIPELSTGVPAFLAKLWKLVEDPETDDLICWSPNGRSFFIRNQARFARELLPHYYKHNNMASFVRQLNMYGFHKKVSVELGGLKCDRDEMEFAHQFFCKGHAHLVEHIKRKIASNKGQDPAHTPMKPELMNKMLTEVRSMRGRQEHLDSRLGAMKRENEALWRELAMLRQKHLKQQQIVNKLIQFLISLVQPSRSGGLPVKKRYPLMIDDSTRQRKQSKLTKAQTSPTGPVIHELDSSEPDLDSQYIVAEILESQQSPAIESPEHVEASLIDDDNMETIHLVEDAVHLEDNNVKLVNSEDGDIKKNRGCKGKKKRKSKMPVKILIPSTEKGEEPRRQKLKKQHKVQQLFNEDNEDWHQVVSLFREETHLLEIPLEDSPMTVALLENNSMATKPVPVATVRSSKLAAMAANMSKSSEFDNDIDTEPSGDIDDDIQENDSTLIKLEDILIVPEVTNDDVANEGELDKDGNNTDDEFTRSIARRNVKIESAEREVQEGDKQITTSFLDQEKDNCNDANTSDSVDLHLSCVNPSGTSGTTYREEMDNHLETMQTELENLREILRAEGYTIDANTLLGLFGADDSPVSFGLPVNPDMDTREKEDEDHNTESMNGGELMAYNPPPSLLDFDDIFLGATTSSPIANLQSDDMSTNNLYDSDPLDLEDSKTSLLDSLVTTNKNSTS